MPARVRRALLSLLILVVASWLPLREGKQMMEGLLEPMHLLVLFAVLLFAGVPFFLVCRWLWRKGSAGSAGSTSK